MSRYHLLAMLALGACAAPSGEVGLSDLELDALRPGDYHEARVLVGAANLVPDHARFRGESLRVDRTWGSLKAAVFEVPATADVLDVVRELRASGEFLWVEPDLTRQASATDPYRPYQWHFDAINLDGAQAITDGTGAVVAVLDTGAASGPYDGLANLGSGYDFANGDSDPTDDNGHGSHVSGTINQATNNGAGVSGIAYGATLMPIKVLDSAGSGYVSDIVDGLTYAADNGADVANMSYGSSTSSATEQAAITYAYDSGMFLAGAAGNSNRTRCDYPGRYSQVACIGATNAVNARAWYSNRGTGLELMAPGGDTGADLNGDGYADGVLQETMDPTWGYYFWQGTSMATPHVAGVAGLLASVGASRDEIRTTLQDTAQDLGRSGFDTTYGYGLIDAEAALVAFAGTSTDADGDGWTTTDGDCDDADAAINPGATDVPYDGVDSDCSGGSDYDADGDGYDSDTYGGLDCDDAVAGTNPDAAEVCDGDDNDCDGLIDDDDPGVTGLSTWYLDSDGDTYGDPGSSLDACEQPASYVDDDTDCDDGDSTIYPGAEEVCEDGVDQDCDGSDDTCSTADVTPPTISSLASSRSGRYLQVTFATDELATGRVCNDKGYCANTALGTSHDTGWFYGNKGHYYQVTATDAAGNVTTTSWYRY